MTYGRYHDENVGRSSGEHRPTLHRQQNTWIGGSVYETSLTKKSSADQKNSVKIGADVARFSQFLFMGTSNVTVAIVIKSSDIMIIL